MIRPIPEGHGVGFTTFKPIFEGLGYEYSQVGRYCNYMFTAANWDWPTKPTVPAGLIFDAFSPNMNKTLHVGHLRNLALAKSLRNIFETSRFVAMLGYSLGEKPGASAELHAWFDFLDYHPEVFSDEEVSTKHPIQGIIGEGEYLGCLVWNGKKSPVVIVRQDGRKTYAHHDLSFQKEVCPTHYLTGAEQKEHFDNLGLGDKHLPMGLVLDPVTGKKMKSRDGTALTAVEAFEKLKSNLKQTPDIEKVAWNILAWNFLSVSRTKNVSFAVDSWTSANSPGMYVTYTYARVMSALDGSRVDQQPAILTDKDIALLGISSYFNYYLDKAVATMDPIHLAQYSLSLAKALTASYNEEKISGGRLGHRFAVTTAANALCKCLSLLGLFPLVRV